MTSEPAASAPLPPHAPELARDVDLLLDNVMARVGVDGITAALVHPGLLAAVDQHAAAVREALGRAGRPVDAAGLASYAKSIMAAARRMGRTVPEPGGAQMCPSAWLRAEWHLLRLVAVCAIASSAGLV